ncbi:hypothetical protein AURDEDRAFT_77544 [Auricularia subglabra TFB-10046 SS5]|uniref:Homeodomain-like protein n=1 Tax=Auricularia subglabra (strain TFB-10046 / SS5) TaxID=717982 RepID=J0CR07_AURST|nr:hypothetical protein AURDEDRAFT_77544 [Auricularia subglabra TFB-10046 SS5]
MVYRKIGDGIRQRTVALLGAGWTVYELSIIMDVNTRSIYRWKRNVEEYGDVLPPPSPICGRPRLLSGEDLHEVLLLLERLPQLYLREIREWIAMHRQVKICDSVIQSNLEDLNITYKILRRNAIQRDEEERATFADIVWNQIHAAMCVCIDESSKDNRTIYRHYGRTRWPARCDSCRWCPWPALEHSASAHAQWVHCLSCLPWICRRRTVHRVCSL